MKILLVQCPLWGTYEPPIAIAQLASCLKKENHKVLISDLNIKLYLNRPHEYKNFWAWEQSDFWYNQALVEGYIAKNSEEINAHLEGALEKEIGLVGFSVNMASLHMSNDIARRIKSRDKGVTVVFGGPLFLNKKYIHEVLQNSDVDVVVYGEGEHAFTQLAGALSKKGNIKAIPGIAFRQNGSVCVNDPASQVNLDDLPFLDFVSLPLTDYDDARHIPFMASRGCIRRCYFCSDAPCWPGYRAMSGERVFQEIAYHKNIYRDIGHIRFIDLEFNGNMNSLVEFSDLMRDRPLDVNWSANMVVRPELTRKVIEKMARSGCEHIIFGIESGSESLLKRMNKYYNIKDADRIIRQMHEAGICVTANFMFGFPGETEDDFTQTLAFLKRNANFLGRAYPSRTYFALEEFSYVYDHPEEFGIKPGASSHLFWESQDGLNTYPLRMDRCRRFCELALKLGVEVGAGVQTSVMQDEWFNLSYYYEKEKNYPKAVEHLLNYYDMDPRNEVVNKKIIDYEEKTRKGVFLLEGPVAEKLVSSAQQIHNGSVTPVQGEEEAVTRLEDRFSIALLKTKVKNLTDLIETKAFNSENKEVFSANVNSFISLMADNAGYDNPALRQDYIQIMEQLSRKNSALNEQEFAAGRAALASSPKMFFLQFAGPCNSSCVFCSRGHDYEYFNLDKFKTVIESRIALELAMAEQFVFTGSGEFLRLPQWMEILNYFEGRYPHITKMFSTNSSSLRPEVVDLITAHQSRYQIHASLHASNAKLHKVMTRMDNFPAIIEQVRYLLQERKKHNNININLFFVATVLNISDLPDFVRLAKNLGVDGVVVNYNYIYAPAQKYLSCYFNQDHTNRMLEESGRLAEELKIRISLPPKFGLSQYPQTGICRELWSQIMLNEKGDVLPCDASHDCGLKLKDGVVFDNIWNSDYYVNIRRELLESGHGVCFQHCHRANPATVNQFASHVIHRGRDGLQINESWEDNF